MGSTVFLESKVHSFRTQSGRIGYVWSEQTYEKKEGPRYAHWCVMKIGHREQMIERIFALAESIPGGMLHVKNANAKSFIAYQLKQLQQPLQLEQTQYRFANSRDGFYSPIRDGNRERVKALLAQAGKPQLAAAIARSPEAGGGKHIDLDLATDLDLIVALTRRQSADEGPLVLPWTIIQSKPNSGEAGPREDIAMPRVAANVDLQAYSLGFGQRSGLGELYAVILDGKPHFGHLYELESRLIKAAAQHEVVRPGYYKSLLTEWERLTAEPAQLPLFPTETVFRIDASGASDYHQRNFSAICAAAHGEPRLQFELTLENLQATVRSADGYSESDRWARYYIPYAVLQTTEHVEVLLPEEQQEIDSTVPRERGG
jgi:hypothetical protein